MGRGITTPSSTCSGRQVPSSPCLHSPFWKQGQEQQLTHTDRRLLGGENALSSAAKQARLQAIAALPCLSPTPSVFPNTLYHLDALHKQLSQKQSWRSSSIINAPYCFSRTHTTDNKRKIPTKTKTKPPRIKVVEALFYLVQIKNNRSHLFQL